MISSNNGSVNGITEKVGSKIRLRFQCPRSPRSNRLPACASSEKATEIALRALDKEMDENLDFALWLTCRETQDAWLPAFQKGEITFGGNFAHAIFALKATGNPAAFAPSRRRCGTTRSRRRTASR